MAGILKDAIAIEREATNKEKQKSAEKRFVHQYVKSGSSNQPVAPAPTAKPKAKPEAKVDARRGKTILTRSRGW